MKCTINKVYSINCTVRRHAQAPCPLERPFIFRGAAVYIRHSTVQHVQRELCGQRCARPCAKRHAKRHAKLQKRYAKPYASHYATLQKHYAKQASQHSTIIIRAACRARPRGRPLLSCVQRIPAAQHVPQGPSPLHMPATPLETHWQESTTGSLSSNAAKEAAGVDLDAVLEGCQKQSSGPAAGPGTYACTSLLAGIGTGIGDRITGSDAGLETG